MINNNNISNKKWKIEEHRVVVRTIQEELLCSRCITWGCRASTLSNKCLGRLNVNATNWTFRGLVQPFIYTVLMKLVETCKAAHFILEFVLAETNRAAITSFFAGINFHTWCLNQVYKIVWVSRKAYGEFKSNWIVLDLGRCSSIWPRWHRHHRMHVRWYCKQSQLVLRNSARWNHACWHCTWWNCTRWNDWISWRWKGYGHREWRVLSKTLRWNHHVHF